MSQVIISNRGPGPVQVRSGPQGQLMGDVSGALPYAGIGYASAGLNGAWGFSADLGLAAQGLGALRLDRLISGNGLSVDGSLRVLPMVRLGMSLRF